MISDTPSSAASDLASRVSQGASSQSIPPFTLGRGSDDGAVPRYPAFVAADYRSGDDYEVEFLEHRFSFGREDFEERVVAAAVKLGLVERGELDGDETADLVELTADGQLAIPRSALGHYVVRHWERISLVGDESLVYWLRRLVFRSAWLDHRVKQGLLDVTWDESTGEFTYSEPNGSRALLEMAPVPSWHEMQFRP